MIGLICTQGPCAKAGTKREADTAVQFAGLATAAAHTTLVPDLGRDGKRVAVRVCCFAGVLDWLESKFRVTAAG